MLQCFSMGLCTPQVLRRLSIALQRLTLQVFNNEKRRKQNEQLATCPDDNQMLRSLQLFAYSISSAWVSPYCSFEKVRERLKYPIYFIQTFMNTNDSVTPVWSALCLKGTATVSSNIENTSEFYSTACIFNGRILYRWTLNRNYLTRMNTKSSEIIKFGCFRRTIVSPPRQCVTPTQCSAYSPWRQS